MQLNVIQADLKSSQCWSVVFADHVLLFNIQVYEELQMTHTRSERSYNLELHCEFVQLFAPPLEILCQCENIIFWHFFHANFLTFISKAARAISNFSFLKNSLVQTINSKLNSKLYDYLLYAYIVFYTITKSLHAF